MSLRFNEWGAPLRPTPEDVGMYRNQVDPKGKTLLLGVTSELMPLATVAVDHNPKVIEAHRAHAVLADWGDLPFKGEFDTVIGDGSLNVFQGSVELFFEQAKKVLKPGGQLILRVYISPETKEDLQTVFIEKGKTGFHAFKWRVAHAIANPYVSVEDLYEAIHPIEPHPTLDVYRNSDLIYYFPKLSELPRWDAIQFGTTYDLADRCPVITWKK